MASDATQLTPGLVLEQNAVQDDSSASSSNDDDRGGMIDPVPNLAAAAVVATLIDALDTCDGVPLCTQLAASELLQWAAVCASAKDQAACEIRRRFQHHLGQLTPLHRKLHEFLAVQAAHAVAVPLTFRVIKLSVYLSETSCSELSRRLHVLYGVDFITQDFFRALLMHMPHYRKMNEHGGMSLLQRDQLLAAAAQLGALGTALRNNKTWDCPLLVGLPLEQDARDILSGTVLGELSNASFVGLHPATRGIEASAELWRKIEMVAALEPPMLPDEDIHLEPLSGGPEASVEVTYSARGRQEVVGTGDGYVAPMQDKHKILAALVFVCRTLRTQLAMHATAQALKAHARRAFTESDWSLALSLYEAAVLFTPADDLLHSNEALCLLKLGAPLAAVDAASQALQLNCRNAKAAHHLLRAHIALGRVTQRPWILEIIDELVEANVKGALEVRKLQPEFSKLPDANADDARMAFLAMALPDQRVADPPPSSALPCPTPSCSALPCVSPAQASSSWTAVSRRQLKATCWAYILSELDGSFKKLRAIFNGGEDDEKACMLRRALRQGVTHGRCHFCLIELSKLLGVEQPTAALLLKTPLLPLPDTPQWATGQLAVCYARSARTHQHLGDRATALSQISLALFWRGLEWLHRPTQAEQETACLAMIEDAEWAKGAFRSTAEARTWKRTTDQELLQKVMMRGFCGQAVTEKMMEIYAQEWRTVGMRTGADGDEVTSIQAIS
mmetsp:Transcript_38558/g.121509  ORF Transcript_38558/g.121509 Transcript_38558/m.121509 type:complete len:733 (-) Transcript_38558:139-2337(-)